MKSSILSIVLAPLRISDANSALPLSENRIQLIGMDEDGIFIRPNPLAEIPCDLIGSFADN